MAGTTLGSLVIPVAVVRVGDKKAIPNLEKELASLHKRLRASAVKEAEKDQKAYEKAVKKTTSTTKNAGKTEEKKTKLTKDQQKELDKLLVTMKGYDKATVRNIMGGKNNNKVVGQTIVLTKKLANGVTMTTTIIKKQAGSWGGIFARANVMLNQLRWSMVNVGFAVGFLAALASPFVAMTKDAMEFERQLRKIQSISGASIGDSEKQILSSRAGRPFSKNEVADALTEFSRAGFTAEESASALNDILNLSQVGFIELGEAAKVVATMIRAFSLSAEDSTHIVDVLTTAADSAKTDIQGLTSALGFVATVAEGAGQSMETTVAMIQVLQNAGLNGSKAGTALRQTLSALIDPSEKAKKAMEEIGVSVVDSSGNLKQITDFIVELKAALSDLTEGEANKKLGEIFRVRALAGVQAAIGALDELGGTFDGVIQKNNTAGASIIKTMIQNRAQINKATDATNAFKDSFLKAGQTISEGVAPEIMASLKVIGNLVGKITVFIADMITGFVKLAPLIGLVTVAVIALNAQLILAAIASGLATAGVSTTMGLAALAVATLATGVGFLSRKWDESGAALSQFDKSVDKVNEVMHRNRKEADLLLATYNKFPGVVDLITQRHGEYGQEVGKLLSDIESLNTKVGREIEKLEELNSKVAAGASEWEEARDEQAKYVESLTIGLDRMKVKLQNLQSVDEFGVFSSIDDLESFNTAIGKIDTALTNVRQTVEGGIFEKLLGEDKFTVVSDTLKTLVSSVKESADSIVADIRRIFVENVADGFLYSSTLLRISDAITNAYEEIKVWEQEIKSLTIEQEELKLVIEQTTEDISKQNKVIQELNDDLKDTNKIISDLKKARFTGESQTLAVLKKAAIFRKKEELAALGVADAQMFINDALSLGMDEYDQLFERLSKINSEMEENTNAFDAWQASIKEAIRAEVEAGEQLGADVTSRVKQWQTALLGISATQGGLGSDNTAFDDYINKLQLAYDVHFGGMHDEVTNFLNEQQDREIGVFDTSSQLIDALRNEFDIRANILGQLVDEEDELATLNKKLEDQTTKLGELETSIENLKTDIDANILSLQNLSNSFDIVADHLIKRSNEFTNPETKPFSFGIQPDGSINTLPGLMIDSIMSDIADSNNFGAPSVSGVTDSPITEASTTWVDDINNAASVWADGFNEAVMGWADRADNAMSNWVDKIDAGITNFFNPGSGQDLDSELDGLQTITAETSVAVRNSGAAYQDNVIALEASKTAINDTGAAVDMFKTTVDSASTALANLAGVQNTGGTGGYDSRIGKQGAFYIHNGQKQRGSGYDDIFGDNEPRRKRGIGEYSGDLSKPYNAAYGAISAYAKEGQVVTNVNGQKISWRSGGRGPNGERMFNDFIQRPGQAPINFSPNDTLIGVKDTSSLGGGVQIGAINVTGVSGNPEDIGRQIAETIKRELNAA